MSDSKLDFSKARPGDVLWSDRFGSVTFRRKVEGVIYSVQCEVRPGISLSWTNEGWFADGEATNDLHWSRPVFEEHLPPKRMAKVNIEKTIHVTKWGLGKEQYSLWIQPKHQKCPWECIHHFNISHEFEVEE